jgi:hypothetical protein
MTARTVLPVLVALILTGCNVQAELRPATTADGQAECSHDTVIVLVRGFFDAWNSGRLTELRPLLGSTFGIDDWNR